MAAQRSARRADGFTVKSPADAAQGAGLVAMLTPDMTHKAIFEEIRRSYTAARRCCSRTASPCTTARCSRRTTSTSCWWHRRRRAIWCAANTKPGSACPACWPSRAMPTGHAHARGLAYAHYIGGTRSGVLETTFAEETETDLFGEQAVLCGGATELVVKGFETLVEAGYQPEVAYFECLHELKLIVDLLYEGGLAKMHQFVSDTAKYGDLTRGPRVVDDHVKRNMRVVLDEIRSGRFAREWIDENSAGCPNYREALARDLDQPIERVGRGLRERMAWLRRSAAA